MLLKEFLIINCHYRFPFIKPIYSLNLLSHLLADLIFLTLWWGRDSVSLICRGESPTPQDTSGLSVTQSRDGREGLESTGADCYLSHCSSLPQSGSPVLPVVSLPLLSALRIFHGSHSKQGTVPGDV